MMKISTLQNIYFACTGNTCRSPLAQKILQEELVQRGSPEIRVQSRRASMEENSEGYSRHDASAGEPLSAGTREIIVAFYRDTNFVNKHYSRAFTADELQESDLVVAMTMNHKDALTKHEEAFTQDKKVKVYTLGELLGAPREDVSDPLGSDQRLLESTYCQERGITLKRLYAGSKKEKAAQEMLRYFGPDRVKKIILAAYLPTYKELKEKISRLCQEEINTISIEQLFREEIGRRKTRVLHSAADSAMNIGSAFTYHDRSQYFSRGKPGSPATPEEMYQQGSYNKASEIMNNQRVRILRSVEAVRRLLLQLPDAFDKTQTNKDVNKVCQRAHKTIHHKIVPSLLTGKYWRQDFTFDSASLSANLVPALLETTPFVLKGMERSPLDKAFQIRKNATEMISLAEIICSEEDMREMYHEISKK